MCLPELLSSLTNMPHSNWDWSEEGLLEEYVHLHWIPEATSINIKLYEILARHTFQDQVICFTDIFQSSICYKVVSSESLMK